MIFCLSSWSLPDISVVLIIAIRMASSGGEVGYGFRILFFASPAVANVILGIYALVEYRHWIAACGAIWPQILISTLFMSVNVLGLVLCAICYICVGNPYENTESSPMKITATQIRHARCFRLRRMIPLMNFCFGCGILMFIGGQCRDSYANDARLLWASFLIGLVLHAISLILMMRRGAQRPSPLSSRV